MSKIIILCAPAGAGKSTLARQYELEGFVRINQDDQGKEGHIFKFKTALTYGYNVIIDRLNFSKVQRDKYLKPAKDLGYESEIIILHEPYEVCLKRCLERKDHPTIKCEKDARSALATFFGKYEKPTADEADVITNLGWDKPDKPNTICCDLDNTLAETSHREHFLQGTKRNWRGFFEAMGEDKINVWCKELLNGMGYCAEVVIVSARPDDYRKITESWLLHNEVRYDNLIMRSRGDFRKDSIVKLQLYEFEIKTRYNVLFWVDDRKQVIDEMRNNGVIVLDCAGEKGNF